MIYSLILFVIQSVFSAIFYIFSMFLFLIECFINLLLALLLWLEYFIVLFGLSLLIWFCELYPDPEAEAEFLEPLQLDASSSELPYFPVKHDKNRPVAIVHPYRPYRPPSPPRFGLGRGHILNLMVPNANPAPFFFHADSIPDSLPDSPPSSPDVDLDNLQFPVPLPPPIIPEPPMVPFESILHIPIAPYQPGIGHGQVVLNNTLHLLNPPPHVPGHIPPNHQEAPVPGLPHPEPQFADAGEEDWD